MRNATRPQRHKFGTPNRTMSATLATTVLFVWSVLAPSAAHAQTYTEEVLYRFTGQPDGLQAEGGLVRDAQGNLYGTTTYGGDGNCQPSPGCGTVFRLDPLGKETVLHSFTAGADGAFPWTVTLARDAQGSLYGTTLNGGVLSSGTSAVGTVFKIDAQGNETILALEGPADPQGGLLLDSQGNLFGTSELGGDNLGGGGSVFKVDPLGNQTILHTFGFTDGRIPRGAVIEDAQGNLYGTTANGGASCPPTNSNWLCGTVYELDSSGNETVLHVFAGPPADGMIPQSRLVMDSQGNLYGTTVFGGSGDCQSNANISGCGTVFKLDATGNETVLHNFSGADGAYPSAGLILDVHGNLYGTTLDGGGTNCPVPTSNIVGCGTIFKLDPAGNETVLYAFTGRGGDGSFPDGELIVDAAGNLYGTTSGGGTNGNGTVFELQISTGFTLGGSASASVNRGATTNNTVTIPVNPSGGFTGNVTLTAAITSGPAGAQDPPTFSFGSTSPVSIAGTTAGMAILTISTTPPAVASLGSPNRRGLLWYGTGSAGIIACVMFLSLPKRGRSRRKLSLLLLVVAFLGALPACGGGSQSNGSGGSGNPGTTPGLYTVTVTGTSGNITATETINLTVQ